jgi:DNA-binding NarL/FixJ family response regulator
MGYAKTSIANDDARAGTPELGQDVDAQRPHVGVGATADRSIALIEARPFVRECIRLSMQSGLALPIATYSTASELEGDTSAKLVVLSLMDASQEACAGALLVLAEHIPGVPIIVLASTNDVDLARTAISHGAKGYIPCTMGFEIALEAMRFVLVGGSYAPVDCLLAAPAQGPTSETLRDQPSPRSSEISEPLCDLTPRERKVVQAIQRGKSNKIIAYELNMCESTVKVHVRNVMKKWKARNRTDVAIRAQTVLGPGVCAAAA